MVEAYAAKARRSPSIFRTQATAEFKLALVRVFKLVLLGGRFTFFPQRDGGDPV